MVTLVKRHYTALLSRDYARQHRLEITGNRGSAIRYRCLDYHLENGIATVTLDRPDNCNCVDQLLAAEMREVCGSIREEPGVRAVIFTGTGKHFSIGRASPPPAIAGGSAGEKLDWLRSVQVASSIAAIEVPVLVAVNGDALDHGLEMALAGDIRIASHHSRFGLTGLAEGRLPWDGGTQRLPRLVGPAWAQDMILTSRLVNAAEALSIGLVNRVVDDDELMTEASAMAQQIAGGAPIAARYLKEAVSQGLDLTLVQGLRLETDLNVLLHSTADRAEGIASFLERRAPEYTGE